MKIINKNFLILSCVAIFCCACANKGYRYSSENNNANKNMKSGIKNNYVIYDKLMQIQAEEFLKNMPSDLQHLQAVAIAKAINGDNKDLQQIRVSRNKAPEISDNVRVKMLTKTLRLYESKDSDGKLLPVLIYLHGGGWTFGSLNSCGRFCNALAASGKIRVIAVEYRLAPENPFPMSLYDCMEAALYVSEHAAQLGVLSNAIAMGGDSAGGNLAVATALSPKCKDLINALVLFYPVTKVYDDESESWKKYGKGYGLDSEVMNEFNRAYVGDNNAKDTIISVGLCTEETLQQLPRTLLVAAGHDVLCDQGKEFAYKMGDNIVRYEFKNAIHLFITVPGQDKAFEEAVNLTLNFISEDKNNFNKNI